MHILHVEYFPTSNLFLYLIFATLLLNGRMHHTMAWNQVLVHTRKLPLSHHDVDPGICENSCIVNPLANGSQYQEINLDSCKLPVHSVHAFQWLFDENVCH